jgi:hypothetical protein
MAMADLADRGKLVCPTSGYLSLSGKFKRETVQDSSTWTKQLRLRVCFGKLSLCWIEEDWYLACWGSKKIGYLGPISVE